MGQDQRKAAFTWQNRGSLCEGQSILRACLWREKRIWFICGTLGLVSCVTHVCILNSVLISFRHKYATMMAIITIMILISICEQYIGLRCIMNSFDSVIHQPSHVLSFIWTMEPSTCLLKISSTNHPGSLASESQNTFLQSYLFRRQLGRYRKVQIDYLYA